MDEAPTRKPNPAILVIAGLAIVIGLAVLVFALTRAAPDKATAPASNETAPDTHANTTEAAVTPDWTITSTNPKVKVTLLADLLKSSGEAGEGEACSEFASPPESPQARAATAKGWLIAGEKRLGPLTAILIASSFETSTGGFCYANNGNVALFDGDRLVGLLYSAKGSNETIGDFEPVGGALRVGTGALGGPLGDLTVSDHAIRLGPIAASDSVCGGRRRVPNIFGQTIAVARRKLGAAGWRPVPSTEPVEFFAAELRGKGVVEVKDCAPTGLGQCEFSYAAGRDTLSVGTIGDVPEQVTNYSVECH